MKKFYSIIAIAAISVSAYAQTQVVTEDFSTYVKGGNTSNTGTSQPDATDIYAPGTTALPAGVPSVNFPTGTKVYMAGGAAKLGTSSLSGSMTSKTVDLSTNGGNVRVTFDVKGWTTKEGDIKVTITGQPAQTVTYAALLADNFETKTVNFTGGAANSTVNIETTAKRAFIDNVKVETVPQVVLGLANTEAAKIAFVKNTMVENNLFFGAKSDVQIISMDGQVVKAASVNDGTSLDLSGLAKGIYIVTGTVNGEKVSQKIIKK